MSNSLKRLVIVDDSPVIMELIKKIVQGIEAEIYLTTSFEEAEQYCADHCVNILITDLNLDEHSGFTLIEVAQREANNSDFKSFVMSAESPKEYREQSKKLNLYGWIMKPINPASFKAILTKLTSQNTTDSMS